MVKLDLKNKYWCALLISVAASMGVLILNSNRFVSASVNSEYPSKMQSTIINSHSDEKPSSSIAYVVTKTILEKDFLNVHTTSIKSNPKIDVIIAPSGMNETEASQWLENAKSVALKDYLKTGRVQKVKMANETNIMTIIGSSSIPSVSAVEVSRYQNWMTQSDYTKLSKIGVKAAVIKISEGRSVENKFAAQQIEMAKSAGMRVSVYHFAHFTNSAEAEQEAVWTEKNISNLGLPKSTLIIADMEASESIYAANVGSNLNQFWKQLKSDGYNNHGVYTSHGYSTRDAMVKTVGSERSWIAQYPKSPSNTKLLNSEFGAWQFSSTAAIPGDTNVKHVLDVSHDYSGMLTGCLFNSGERTLKYVTITNSTASIYSDFNFKVKARSADYFHRTLKVKRIYYRSNGGTYYSLYDNNNS